MGRQFFGAYCNTACRFDVRFGSEADICSAKCHVRFTPNSDRESGFPQAVMSALGQKRTQPMTAKGQKRTFSSHLLDDFIDCTLKQNRHTEAQRLGRLEVDHKLKFG